MIARCKLRYFLLIALISIVLPSAHATPVVIEFFKGGGASITSNDFDPTYHSGLNKLNTEIRDQFVGHDFYTRVFEASQTDEAINYTNSFGADANVFLIGHSLGGYSALQVAENFNGERNIQSLVQLDPFRCLLGACTVQGMTDIISNWFLGDDQIVYSHGTQTVPPNVTNAVNYYQITTSPDLLQGDTDVQNSININAETLLNSNLITHTNIDDNTSLWEKIIDAIKPMLSSDVLIKGLGGTSGFGELVMLPNDDYSSNQLNLPFPITLGEPGNDQTTYNNFYVNNNGNLTFNGPLGEYTPTPFPVTSQPMIAPFWGDVDTRGAGAVYVAAPTADTVVITWDNVGYYGAHSDKTNTFQAVLRDRSDKGIPGAFDVEYHYDRLTWTTGDASGGINGFGGTPAQVGYDSGNGINSTILAGSGTSSVLNLQNTSSNMKIPIPGVHVLTFKAGEPSGSTPANPLLPDVQEDGWHFEFGIGNINQRIFIDPNFAIGYDYIVDSGPNFGSVLLPSGIGNNLFDLWYYDSAIDKFFDSGIDITGGIPYDFTPGGVNRFRILGVELSAGLNPIDVTAFVTGLTFVDTGVVQMRQIAIVAGNNVPEPTTIALMLTGLGSLIFLRRRKYRAQ